MSPVFFGCSYYRGFLVIEESGEKPGDTTNVFYRNIWLPCNLSFAASLKEKMKKDFVKRFRWMKEYYEGLNQQINHPLPPAKSRGGEQASGYDSGHEDPGSNLVLPVMQGKYKLEVQATIAGAQIDDVWDLVQDFGIGCEKWWMRSSFLQFEGDDISQYLGCIRRLSRHGQVIRDKLIFISPNDYKLMFETVERIPNPYGFSNYCVLIALEPGHREPDEETEVELKVCFDCLPVIKPTVESQLKAQCSDSLRRLKDLFKKPVGRIEITLVSGEDIGLDRECSIDSYCSISVDSGEVVSSTVCKGTSNPKWNESYNFSVYSTSSVVNVALWDKSDPAAESDLEPPEDVLLGLITFELPNNPKSADTKYKVDCSTGKMFFKIKFSSTPGNSFSHATKPSVVRQVDYLRDCLVATYLELPQLRNDRCQWKVQKKLKSATSVEMGNLPGYWEVVPHMERTNPSKMSTVLAELATCTSSFRGHVVSQKTNPKSRVEAVYCKYLPLPNPVLENYENDNDFCLRFFIGLAPNLVSCVKSLDQIPTPICKLYAEGDLVDLISQRSLFCVKLSYVTCSVKPDRNQSNVDKPVLIFAGNLTEGFRVHGIILSSEINDVYTPKSVENNYRLAKLYFTNALMIHHVYFNVLLRNFYLESICLAIHQALPTTHPLRKLLLPYLNEIVHKAVFLRKIFTEEDSQFADYVFSIGKFNAMGMIASHCREREVVESFFDVGKDLETRGFDFTCPNYLYQHDVLRLHEVISYEVSQYLGKHYSIDRDVESDSKLKNFFETIVHPEQCNLNLCSDGVKTRSALTRFATAVIFSATAHTSAFEKNLYDDGSLIAGVATSMTKPVPRPNEPCPDNLFDYFFAPNDELFLQVLLCRVLSVNTSQPLAQHSSAMSHKLPEKFLKLSTEIKSRNSRLRGENKTCSFVEYSRLDPFNIPSVAGL